MKRNLSRKEFFTRIAQGTVAVAAGGIGYLAAEHAKADNEVWQIDPELCTQCGRCADYCVKPVSAVKCFHAHDVCGYCDLCGGYLKPESKVIGTAAENQLCPTGAIIRAFVEEPYYEYTIKKDLCIGCAKCVKGCGAFGNGSLYLQIDRKDCKDCNICKIATVCPPGAIKKIDAKKAYKFRGDLQHG